MLTQKYAFVQTSSNRGHPVTQEPLLQPLSSNEKKKAEKSGKTANNEETAVGPRKSYKLKEHAPRGGAFSVRT